MEDRGVFESRIEKRGNSRKDGKEPKHNNEGDKKRESKAEEKQGNKGRTII